jgi:hypothetical protein
MTTAWPVPHILALAVDSLDALDQSRFQINGIVNGLDPEPLSQRNDAGRRRARVMPGSAFKNNIQLILKARQLDPRPSLDMRSHTTGLYILVNRQIVRNERTAT